MVNFDKPEQKPTPESLIDTISWGDGLRFPKRPARLSTGFELDLDYFVIGDDGTLKCLSRDGVLAYFGDQKTAHGQEELDEHICVTQPCPHSSHRTPRTPQHHVCHSETCVHDYLAPPSASPKNDFVVPLWEAPLGKKTA